MDMEETRSLVADIAVGRFQRSTNRLAVYRFLVTLQGDRRLYMFNGTEDYAQLWENDIRPFEAVVDFVMQIRSELRFRHDSFDALVSRIATSYHFNYHEETVVDDDTAGRLPEVEVLRLALRGNDWMIGLYLLEMLDVSFLTPLLTSEELGRLDGSAENTR